MVEIEIRAESCGIDKILSSHAVWQQVTVKIISEESWVVISNFKLIG
jgi:hypothetical protein